MVTTSIPALVTPALLQWAREQARMQPALAAKKAAVSQVQLSHWEKGTQQPTLRQARLLAAAYRQPLAAFYLDEAPKVTVHLPKDYRRLAGTFSEEVSPSVHLDVREAWDKRAIALELLHAQGRRAKPFKATADQTEDPEQVGNQLRRLLRVSIDEQSKWRDTRRAFNAWRARAEWAGLLVLQTSSLVLEELRAYSLYAEPLPIVVVNRKDVPAGRTFSLLHELVHLALHTEGLCDLTTNVERSPEEQRLEVFCNAVAAACLIPTSSLLGHQIVREHRTGAEWDDQEVQRLARFFSTSREALLRRLLTLGLTDGKFYERKRKEYEEEYKKRPRTRGIVTPPVNALSLLGRPFVDLVLSNLDSGRITTSDAADYLGLRLKHLPALTSSMVGE